MLISAFYRFINYGFPQNSINNICYNVIFLSIKTWPPSFVFWQQMKMWWYIQFIASPWNLLMNLIPHDYHTWLIFFRVKAWWAFAHSDLNSNRGRSYWTCTSYALWFLFLHVMVNPPNQVKSRKLLKRGRSVRQQFTIQKPFPPLFFQPHNKSRPLRDPA